MNEQLEAIKYLEYIMDNKTFSPMSKKEFVDAQRAIEVLKQFCTPKKEEI